MVLRQLSLSGDTVFAHFEELWALLGDLWPHWALGALFACQALYVINDPELTRKA